ncbi:MAG: iron-containing alcohol dehydrogenase [Leptospiraceae bacterium]|nr:iron-containing alcohol dehydrogenase [Leptospiraceae bacterium]MDW8305852.1 iron-containing alcohol dehydrogenase [Leptospiraceae bacterium]
MMWEFFKFYLPTRVLYGPGLSKRIAEELRPYLKGNYRVLLLTDPFLVKNGTIDSIRQSLQGSQLEIAAIFHDIPPNSELSVVEKATQLGVESKCNFIMAIGGGSVMDTAKVVNILMVKGGDIHQHMGAQLIEGRVLLPSLFIPTTAGTGSEVTEFAVILDSQNKVKLPFTEEAILPDFAILDPQLTVSMPPKLTAATGMDALTHAIESFVSNQANPVSSSLAIYAVELIHANILQACAVPDDLEARGAMLVASFLAGVAFNHAGVGIVHAMSHALGGVYGIPHGVANSIMLPLGMEYNLESSAHRYARLAEAIGVLNLKPAGELAKLSAHLPPLHSLLQNLSFVDEWLALQKAQYFIQYIRQLNQRLKGLAGLPTNLREAGIEDGLGRLDEVVQKAMDDGAHLYNPRPADAQEIRKMIRRAYEEEWPAIPTGKAEIKAAKLHAEKRRPKNVFKDEQMLYDILLGFFEKLKEHPEIGPKLHATGLSVRFNYANPDSSIAIDGRGPEVVFFKGEEARKFQAQVEMSMQADFAHYFWHGKANLLQALARREVIAKGDVPSVMRLLPILEPAYDLYPRYLRERGLHKIIVD